MRGPLRRQAHFDERKVGVTSTEVLGRVSGPLVMIGFGSIGRGVLPLLDRHIEFDRSRCTVIDPEDRDRGGLCALSRSSATTSSRGLGRPARDWR